MSVQQLDPDGEFSKLEEMLAQLGAPLGAQYIPQRHLLSANQLCISITLDLGQQLGIHVEVTTDPNLAQRMDEVPTITPHKGYFILIPSGRGQGYRWSKPDFPKGTFSTQELAEFLISGLKQQIASWEKRFPGTR